MSSPRAYRLTPSTDSVAAGLRHALGVTAWMLVLFVGVILVFVGVHIAAVRAIGLAWGKSVGESGSGDLPAVVLASVALLCAYAGAIRWCEKRRPAELELARLPIELAGGLLIGFLLMTVAILSQWVGGWVSITPEPIRSVTEALAESVKSGVFEETLLRLVVFRLLWRLTNVWSALTISALLFGLIHLLNPHASAFAAICIAFEAGVLLAAFYILTRRIWMSIGVHAGWNFAQGWIFGAAVSGSHDFAGGPLLTGPAPGVAVWLSGGSFGPEASLPILFICAATGLLVLRLAWLQGQVPTTTQAATLPGVCRTSATDPQPQRRPKP